MPNTTTEAIVLRHFNGGIWLNEGEPPNETFATFLSNLDPLDGGGVQKREPLRLNYTIGSSLRLVYSDGTKGQTMSQWMQADPTDGTRYLVVSGQGAGTTLNTLRCYSQTTSTEVWNTTVAGNISAFDFASSDAVAGGNWYVHNAAVAAYRVTVAGVKTTLTETYNDNIAAPTNGNMPAAYVGTQHLSAYYFVGNTTESAVAHPNRIRWSHPGRFEDWRNNDKLDVGDASKVIGLFSIAESLLIVKETQIWLLSGYDTGTFQLRKIVDITQRPSPSTATRLVGCGHAQHGVFIAIQGSGVYRWDGSKFLDVSGSIKDAIVDGRVVIQHMNVVGDVLYCSSGKTFNGVSPAAALTTADLSWEYNVRKPRWTQHNAPFSGIMPVQADVAGAPRAYAVQQLGLGNGYSFSWYRQRVAAGSWCDNWTGSNVDIVCEYRSPWQDAGNPARKKRWRRVFMVWNKRPNASASDPVNYTMDVYKNWDGVHATKTATTSHTKATDTTDYSTLFGYGHAATGSDFDEPDRLSSLGGAYSAQIHLSSTGTPKDQWGFDSVTFKYVPRSLR